MKTILCSLWAILACSLAYAQTEKGRMYLGGSLHVSQEATNPLVSTHYKDVRTSFGISPDWGYFVRDNVSLGVGIGYNKTQIRHHDPTLPAERQKINSNGLSFNVHGRYYMNTPVEKLKFFLQAGVGFGTTNQPQDSIKIRSMYMHVAPNFAYFPKLQTPQPALHPSQVILL
jgi:Outer membrane protein beta-barrel domain